MKLGRERSFRDYRTYLCLQLRLKLDSHRQVQLPPQLTIRGICYSRSAKEGGIAPRVLLHRKYVSFENIR